MVSRVPNFASCISSRSLFIDHMPIFSLRAIYAFVPFALSPPWARLKSKACKALSSKAAFSRYIARVTPASIVERAVPTASPPPAAPGDVIAILAVGISRLPGRTKDALGGVDRTGAYVPGHRGSCHHRKKDCGNANQSEFRHAFLPLVPVTHNTKYG